MLADLTFTFDPVLRLSETATVRLETIALGIVLFIGLLLAARIGSVTPATGPIPMPPGLPPARGLRVDDLVFIVVGVVPGAIVGGRLGYVLDHLEFYGANPNAVLDPAQGGLSLSLAVPFGLITAAIIARLLDAHVGRWMHAAALPLLFVLGAGKLVGVLGASGQGAPSDLQWATSYAGEGPWGSLAAGIPSHPSQVYEAAAVGVALVLTVLVSHFGVAARRDGAAMFFALGFWAIARFATAFTWRDPLVAGPLNTEQLLLIGVMVVALVGLLERLRAPLATLPDLPLASLPEGLLAEPVIAPGPTIEIEAPTATPSLDAASAAEAESLAEAEAAAEAAAAYGEPHAGAEPLPDAEPHADAEPPIDTESPADAELAADAEPPVAAEQPPA